MQTTPNLGLKKPESNEYVNVTDINDNSDAIDEAVSGKVVSDGGDISETVIAFEQADERATLGTNEKTGVLFGKISKWLSDLKGVAFTGEAADLIQDVSNRLVSDSEKSTWNGKVTASGGDVSATKITTLDSISTAFPEPAAGETAKTFLGKVKKFISDFIAIKDTLLTLSNLVNNGQTTASGFALDARYGKTLYDLITAHKSSGDHDGRYYTETEINNKLAYTAGSATINTTQVSTSSNSHIYWKKWGRIVTVEIYDIDLKPGYSTDDMAIIATGLPAAQNQQITAIVGLTSANISDAIRVRLLVDDAGQLKPWFFGTPTSTIYMSGSFTYISAS
ncbi:MAG: hypothetical protein E7250_05465 [Paenibacillaceae bacterium]|nr:hypothetical protein [Paenibacillaceae bacterium]